MVGAAEGLPRQVSQGWGSVITNVWWGHWSPAWNRAGGKGLGRREEAGGLGGVWERELPVLVTGAKPGPCSSVPSPEQAGTRCGQVAPMPGP